VVVELDDAEFRAKLQIVATMAPDQFIAVDEGVAGIVIVVLASEGREVPAVLVVCAAKVHAGMEVDQREVARAMQQAQRAVPFTRVGDRDAGIPEAVERGVHGIQ